MRPFLRELMYILTGFEESVADIYGVFSDARPHFFFFFPAVIYEGMVTNGKAKRSEEGLCRPVPRRTFQTFNSSQKWIKLIKLVGNLHALKYTSYRYTLSHSNAEDTHSHFPSHNAKAQPVLMRASPV